MISKEQQQARALWCEYARPRFSCNQSRVRWAKLTEEVYEAWTICASEAQQHGGRLRFNRTELVMAVVRGLNAACEYCGEYFGVESWGVVRRNPLRNVHGSSVETCDFSIEAMAVCCSRCAEAHRIFTDDEYHRVLTALRPCDAAVTAAAVAALAKGTPRAPGRASNAKRAGVR